MTWQKYRIGDLCRFVRNGKSIKQSKSAGGLPITRIETIWDSKIDATRVGYANLQVGDADHYLLEEGDILFSHINSLDHIGKCALYSGYPHELVHGMNLLCLRPKNELVDPKFFVYLLRTNEFRANLLTLTNKSVNQASISATNLRSIAVEVPSLEEQRRIAAILDTADTLRTKRRQAIAKLDTLLQSTFLIMFGDPVTNPMGWEVRPLERICQAIIDCPHSTPKWSNSGVICLRTSNLTVGGWDWTDTRYVTEHDYKVRTKRSEIAAGDIILSREGTVGIAAIVQAGMRVCMGQRLVQVRSNTEKVTSEFLLRYLLYELAPERIQQFMAGSTSKHLNVKDLRKLNVFVPPLRLQVAYEQIAGNLSKQARLNGNNLAVLDDLFNSLQQRAFRGDL